MSGVGSWALNIVEGLREGYEYLGFSRVMGYLKRHAQEVITTRSKNLRVGGGVQFPACGEISLLAGVAPCLIRQ